MWLTALNLNAAVAVLLLCFCFAFLLLLLNRSSPATLSTHTTYPCTGLHSPVSRQSSATPNQAHLEVVAKSECCCSSRPFCCCCAGEADNCAVGTWQHTLLLAHMYMRDACDAILPVVCAADPPTCSKASQCSRRHVLSLRWPAARSTCSSSWRNWRHSSCSEACWVMQTGVVSCWFDGWYKQQQLVRCWQQLTPETMRTCAMHWPRCCYCVRVC